MPTYSYQCEKEGCAYEFDDVRPMSRCKEDNVCPQCQSRAKRTISLRSAEPNFSDKLYSGDGFYHQGIGEVVQSEAHLKRRCAELGFNSTHEGASMNRKQERMLMSKRVHNNPREIREKIKWSGKGANLPTLEFY